MPKVIFAIELGHRGAIIQYQLRRHVFWCTGSESKMKGSILEEFDFVLFLFAQYITLANWLDEFFLFQHLINPLRSTRLNLIDQTRQVPRRRLLHLGNAINVLILAN